MFAISFQVAEPKCLEAILEGMQILDLRLVRVDLVLFLKTVFGLRVSEEKKKEMKEKKKEKRKGRKLRFLLMFGY